MKNLFFCILTFSLSFNIVNSQSDSLINQTDANGLKQGHWEKHYQNGKLLYVGDFNNNQPIGKMKRYYKSGGLQAVIQFCENSDIAKAKLFYEDGDLSAEGNYFQMQKDSLWKYYSFYTSVIVSDEFYSKGKKTGTHRSYYENGQISEEIEWQNDYKEGKWIQYFIDGAIKMKSNHSFNMVNGRYYLYYSNGLLMTLGNFIDNKRHGIWAFYDEFGKEKYQIEYDFGKAINADAILNNDEEYFKQIEETIGKFEEPSINDFFPGGGGY